LRHGKITKEINSRLKNVNIGFTSDEQLGVPGRPMPCPWTRQMDSCLLLAYNRSNGDSQKTIEQFLSNFGVNVTALEASRRLTSLITLAKMLRANPSDSAVQTAAKA